MEINVVVFWLVFVPNDSHSRAPPGSYWLLNMFRHLFTPGVTYEGLVMDKLAQALVRQVVLQFSATNYKVCPTRYRTRHFFNNSNTNEDIAMKFEQEYVRCVRNEEEYVCSVCVCVSVVRLIVATR